MNYKSCVQSPMPINRRCGADFVRKTMAN